MTIKSSSMGKDVISIDACLGHFPDDDGAIGAGG
jgi:hypothetical protein